MNKVILMGRLTRDPDIRYTDNQTCVARYSLAVDRRYSKEGEQGTDFPSVVSFGKAGEFVEKYLKQGTKVLITGRLQTGNYTNKDGVKIYTTDVITEEIEFAESKKASEDNPQEVNEAGGEFMNIDEKVDLPFKQRG